MPPLNEQSGCVRGGHEEIAGAFDERLVLVGEGGSSQLLFEAIGNATAVELVLQTAVSLVKHDAVRHQKPPRLSPGAPRFAATQGSRFRAMLHVRSWRVE